MDEDLAIGVGLFTLLIGLFALAFYFALQESREWNKFSGEHHCRVVAKIKGSVIPTTGFDSKGNATFGTAYTGDKLGFLCDDGVTYYRDK